jgi:hypothetical protein
MILPYHTIVFGKINNLLIVAFSLIVMVVFFFFFFLCCGWILNVEFVKILLSTFLVIQIANVRTFLW